MSLGKTLLVPPNDETIDINGDYILIDPKDLNLDAQGQIDPNCGVTNSTGIAQCDKLYQPLVMFVGGAKDSTFKPVLGGIFRTYNEENEQYQDVGYGTYKTGGALKSLALHWISKGQKVVFVGHSYGGDAVMDVARELSDMGKEIELVVTLDPVSLTGPRANQPKPKGVKHWLNVYVPYDNYRPKRDNFLNSDSGYSSPKYRSRFANDIAMAGGPWEYCKHADDNQVFLTKTGDEHARAPEMFAFFIQYVQAVK